MEHFDLSIIMSFYAKDEAIRSNAESVVGSLIQQADIAQIATQIIVIDDCSPLPFRGADPATESNYAQPVVHKLPENHGVYHSQNVGLDNAIGDVVVIIDCDDGVKEDYISEVMKAVDGYDYATFPAWTRSGNIIPFRDELYGNYALWAWAFKRDVVKDVRFNENMNVNGDIEYLQRLGLDKLNGNRTNEPIYIYDWNANPDSLSKRFNRGEFPMYKSDSQV